MNESPKKFYESSVDTAEKAKYSLGDEVTLITPGAPPTMTATVTGLLEFGNGGLVGATITIFDTTHMQQAFFDGKDVFSSISVQADDAVSQQQLRDAIAQVLPQGVHARTGDAVVRQNKADIDNAFLKYIRIFMLVFAGIALVVGAFLIINTFSILVAQRSRELALLRALGADRRQVRRSVLTEAVLLGLVGSTLGLAAGILNLNCLHLQKMCAFLLIITTIFFLARFVKFFQNLDALNKK